MHRTFALVFGFAAVLYAQAPQPAWELADPAGKILVGLDLRSLATAPITKNMREQSGEWLRQAQLQTATPPKAGLQPMAQLLMFAPAFQFLKDIDHVLISSSGDFASSAAAALSAKNGTATKERQSYLVVVDGNFPPEHLSLLFAVKHYSYGGVDIYYDADKGRVAYAVLGHERILVGDPKSVQSAIERNGRAPLPNALADHAKTLAASSDLWIVATGLQSKTAATADPLSIFSSQINSIDSGISLRDGLTLDVGADTPSEAVVHSLEQLLSAQIENAAATQASSPDTAEIMRRMQISVRGNRLQMHVSLTEAELEQQIRKSQAARSNTVAGTPNSAPAPAPKPSVPAAPRTVKIFGLDDGVREIPLDSPKK